MINDNQYKFMHDSVLLETYYNLIYNNKYLIRKQLHYNYRM